MNGNLPHIIVALLVVLFLVLLTDPFMYWMPPMAGMAALVLACVSLLVWAGFVTYESASDEREAMHRMNAGRVAYLAGVSVLTLALLVQGLAHAIDPWVALALGVMVIAKVGARIFYDSHQ
jgi:putative flippase GtrA